MHSLTSICEEFCENCHTYLWQSLLNATLNMLVWPSKAGCLGHGQAESRGPALPGPRAGDGSRSSSCNVRHEINPSNTWADVDVCGTTDLCDCITCLVASPVFPPVIRSVRATAGPNIPIFTDRWSIIRDFRMAALLANGIKAALVSEGNDVVERTERTDMVLLGRTQLSSWKARQLGRCHSVTDV